MLCCVRACVCGSVCACVCVCVVTIGVCLCELNMHPYKSKPKPPPSANTQGPVSCEVGKAVLSTLAAEKLQENSHITGAYLRKGLESICRKYPSVVGAIHGCGLYMGVEIVSSAVSASAGVAGGGSGDTDAGADAGAGAGGGSVDGASTSTHTNSGGSCCPQPLPPGTLEAASICERLLELGVICHATGDYSNVLKVSSI